ncbi:MAG: GNAT family N-acetyltransferase [Corallococcus sp.]|nr:GNAT family N-acetyltransferase [Corallococcus sp.]MCM1359253.1 GNAT family N-acetyltransferase [Corallococcus sp.]MCM1394644.1 GNAT family N-acetyltransferase [Corallococcus sp.]
MYKLYVSGKDFLLDNSEILNKYPLETVFFESNAAVIDVCNKTDFAVKICIGEKFLFSVGLCGLPMRIFGDASLCAELAEICVQNGLEFERCLGDLYVCENFLTEYERLQGGRHKTKFAMEIMSCKEVKCHCRNNVRMAEKSDFETVLDLVAQFLPEALGSTPDKNSLSNEVLSMLYDVALLEVDGCVVSIAIFKRDSACLCRITHVFTPKEFRNRGYSCDVVAYLTQRILDSGFSPYLFVDKTNPAANHLYKKIGYEYVLPQYEFAYLK